MRNPVEEVNVKAYGATGNGTDDTAAIEAAWAASGPKHAIYFPPGTYSYNGPGLDGETLLVSGSGWGSIIELGASSYLLKPTGIIGRLELRSLNIVGGKGAVNYIYSGASTNASKIVNNCRFIDYSECAIATEGIDSPYWWVTENYFSGSSSTIGIALATGLTDNSNITGNSFNRNRVGLKLGQGGNNARVRDNEFIRLDTVNADGPRIDVWIVPDNDTVNAGPGMVVTNNKFGNENFTAGDLRIVYADEGEGETNGARFPNLEADSVGYIRGHSIAGNNFVGAADATAPIIYSTTPNVWELAIRDNHIAGASPTWALQYRTPLPTPHDSNSQNLYGPFYGDLGRTSVAFPVSNQINPGYTDDPNYVLQTRADITRHHASGSSASFQSLLSTPLSAFSVMGDVKITPATDAFGGTDAANFTFTGDDSLAYTSLLTCVPGKPAWLEVDVAAPDRETACKAIQLRIMESSSNQFHLWRTVQVPTSEQGWMTYAFPWTPRVPGTSPHLEIWGEETSAVKVGRARVYHATERQLGGTRPNVTGARSTGEAVGSLLSALESQGLIVDNSTTGDPVEVKVAVPATATSAGLVGQWAADEAWLYICIAKDTWARSPLAKW